MTTFPSTRGRPTSRTTTYEQRQEEAQAAVGLDLDLPRSRASRAATPWAPRQHPRAADPGCLADAEAPHNDREGDADRSRHPRALDRDPGRLAPRLGASDLGGVPGSVHGARCDVRDP